LESLDSAVKRGCQIYAEVVGYSSLEGGDAKEAIERTLKQANVNPSQVDCVVVNAAGYGPQDYEEMRHLRRCFGEETPPPALTNISWAVGHTLGAYGAMQAVAAALILKEQRIPPVLYDGGESFSNRPGVKGGAGAVRFVLQNTLGLSGKSSFLLFARHDGNES
jgi:3-oxoacyl-(acyl-carrier-protein) synthase